MKPVNVLDVDRLLIMVLRGEAGAGTTSGNAVSPDSGWDGGLILCPRSVPLVPASHRMTMRTYARSVHRRRQKDAPNTPPFVTIHPQGL